MHIELKELVEINYGKALPVEQRVDGQIPAYGSSGIIGYSEAPLAIKPAIVIARKGSLGSVFLVKTPFWAIDTTYFIHCPNSLCLSYLSYALENLQLARLNKSTAVPGLDRNDLYKCSIPIVPLPEQRAIVAKIESLFSELDAGVASLEAAKAQLKVYRQAVLKAGFEGSLTKEWRTKNLNSITKNEKIKMAKISSLCDVVRGGSPRPAGDARFYGGNIPFLKVADITHDPSIYLESYTFTINEAGLQKTRMVPAETLLLSNSGATLGVPKIVKFQTTFNDGIAAFLGLEAKDLLYHYYFWISKTKELRNIDQGAAQPNLNTNIIGNQLIPVFSDSEQSQIVSEIESRLSLADKLEETIDASLAQTASLRQSVLKRAFEGKLLTPAELEACRREPDWESAEKLLERIKAERAASDEGKATAVQRKRAGKRSRAS